MSEVCLVCSGTYPPNNSLVCDTCEGKDIIGVYLDDSLICVPCSTTGEGERATAQALPDGFTCDNCLEVVNV